ASDNAAVRRIALVALDQMADSSLRASDVLQYLNSPDESLKSTALWVLSRHLEWGDSVVEHFQSLLDAAESLGSTEREALSAQLARFGGAPAMQRLIAEQLTAKNSVARRTIALS